MTQRIHRSLAHRPPAARAPDRATTHVKKAQARVPVDDFTPAPGGSGWPTIGPLGPKNAQGNANQVMEAQAALTQLGCLPPDQIVGHRGEYNASTRLAVQRFQVSHHLPSTGIIDAATAAAMNQALATAPPPPRTKGQELVAFVKFYQDNPQFDHFQDGCLSMVQLAYKYIGATPSELNQPHDAKSALAAYQAEGVVHPFDPNNPATFPPPGAIVLWPGTSANQQNGHIVISLGGGEVISTGWKGQGVAEWQIGDPGTAGTLSAMETTPCAGWVDPPANLGAPVDWT